jgi:hypothetical protein
MRSGNPHKLPPRDRAMIWCGLWGGGCAWFAHLLGAWMFAEFGCLSGMGLPGPAGISQVAWLVLGISALCMALAGAAAVLSRRCGRITDETGRFAERYGVWVNGLFMLIIAAQTAPVFFYLKDCGSYIVR